MSEFHAFEVWTQSNAVLIFVLLGSGFAALVKLSLMVWNQHKELEHSEFKQLVGKMEDLVDQIKFLFKNQDVQATKLDDVVGRVGKVEKRLGEHYAMCKEREKVVLSIKDRQDTAFCKYDKVLMHRKNEPHVIDRTDRET